MNEEEKTSQPNKQSFGLVTILVNDKGYLNYILSREIPGVML